MSEFLTTPLNANHKKSAFKCGNDQLDHYLHRQANQDVKRKLSACFILADKEHHIKGYYTLSNAGLSRDLIPEKIKKRLPMSYSSLPVTLLGRLAVSEEFKGQGVGKLLLIDALKRSVQVSKTVGSMAIIVDPIDENAVLFYEKHQFMLLPGSGKMFLPMKTIEKLFA